jgi:hypothetical protein
MSGGALNRDLLAAAYAQAAEKDPASYRGVKSVSVVPERPLTTENSSMEDAAA